MSYVTFRCSICAKNWPHADGFATCPICDERTRGCNLEHSGVGERAMTLAEARATLAELGIAPPAATPAKRRKPNLGHEAAKLRADLDNWAHTAPDWMKR